MLPFSTTFDHIPAARREDLRLLGSYIAEKRSMDEAVHLIVICTHNSRRSHIGAIALQYAANYFGIEGVTAYSGGTEATAFNPRAVAAMRRAGFNIEQKTEGENPVYSLLLDQEYTFFSKKYDHEANPQEDFAAIMVCTSADRGCPYVAGADARFSLPFIDPKAKDDMPEEAAAYDAAVQKIGNQMLYAMWCAAQVLEL